MRTVRFIIGLTVALVLHLLAARLLGRYAFAFDFFLLLTVFNGIDGRTAAGLFGGMVSGLTADAVTGGLYGLYGFANSLVGYATAIAAQRLAVQRTAGVILLFAIATAAQQAVVSALLLMFVGDVEFPGPGWVGARVAMAGFAGAAGRAGWRRTIQGIESWRRSRRSRLR